MKIHTTILLTILCMPLCAQEILNGSWELNNLEESCNTLGVNSYNDNVLFSSVWTNNFNTSNQVCAIQNETCLWGGVAYGNPVPDGEWFFHLFSVDTLDVLSQTKVTLNLSLPLSISSWYKLTFHDKGIIYPPLFPSEIAKYEIGVSLYPDAFGDYIYSPPLTVSVWTERDTIFQAPNNGQYISIQSILEEGQNTTFLDHFVLEPVADSLQGCTDALAQLPAQCIV